MMAVCGGITGDRGANAFDGGAYDRGVYSVNRFRVAETQEATYSTVHAQDGMTVTRTTGDGVRQTTISAEGLFVDGPGGIRNVDVDAVNHAILHLQRDAKNTLVGSNLVNMGREDYMPEYEHHEYKQNVVLGTDSGNLRGGMERSIIIGSNLANHNPDHGDGGSATADEDGLSLSMPVDLPVTGMFAIGHDTPILSGNMDIGTLNMPLLHSLEDTIALVETNKAAEESGVIFTRNNILQVVNNGVTIDGVQLMLDEIETLKMDVCLLNGGNEESCTAAVDPFQLFITEDMNMWPMEVKWMLQKQAGAGWNDVITYDGMSGLVTIKVFDVQQDYVEDYSDLRVFSGILSSGTYRIVFLDTYGDGWGTLSGAPNSAVIQIGENTQTILEWSGVDWANGGCIHPDLTCGSEASATFTIPLSGVLDSDGELCEQISASLNVDGFELTASGFNIHDYYANNPTDVDHVIFIAWDGQYYHTSVTTRIEVESNPENPANPPDFSTRCFAESSEVEDLEAFAMDLFSGAINASCAGDAPISNVVVEWIECPSTCDENNNDWILNLTDSWGDGWNGGTLQITDCESHTATVFVEGISLPGGAFEAVPVCLPASDGYVVLVEGGDFPSEIAWTLIDDEGAVVLEGGAPSSVDNCPTTP